MRTKTLLLSAVLGAALVVAATAQTPVYSVNVVGYVNVTLVPGFNLIANPLVAQTNTVPELFKGVPNGTVVYKFDPATGYVANNYNFGKWGQPSMTVVPGEGVFVKNPTQTNIVITFVGEVMTGALSNNITAGFQILSSQVPQAGQLDTDLKLPVANGESAYLFVNGAYVVHNYNFGKWNKAPVVDVAQAFFFKAAAAKTWTRDFNPNQ
jgi:hypothetical protein